MVVPSGADVTFIAGTSIHLLPDFEVEANANFDGYIKYCGWHARHGRPTVAQTTIDNEEVIFDIVQDLNNCILRLKLSHENANITAYDLLGQKISIILLKIL